MKIKDQIAKLIDVKSIVTLVLTALLCALAWRGAIPAEVLAIHTTVIGFYFGTQYQKKLPKKEEGGVDDGDLQDEV